MDGPSQELFDGFTRRLHEWREAQAWYPLVRSDDPDVREEGLRMMRAQYEEFEREARAAGAAYLASKNTDRTAELADEFGIPPTLAAEAMSPEQSAQQRAVAQWWTRGRKPVLVLLASARGNALGPAAWCVLKARGRMITAGELARRQFEDAFVRSIVSKRLLAVVDVFAGPVDPKGYFENTLREVIQIRTAAGLKTVLTSPLDRTAWFGAVGAQLRDLLIEQAEGLARPQAADRRGVAKGDE